MTREALDALLAAGCLLALVFLMILLASPDLVGRGIEWVLA